jgi:hypothetical protein
MQSIESSASVVSLSSVDTAPVVPMLSSVNGIKRTDQRYFSPEEVKDEATRFFLAGRGGETTLHPGNKVVRERALKHVGTYSQLKISQRGKKFAKSIFNKDFGDITFVVRKDYFFNNQGWIAQDKYHSVVKEHGNLKSLDDVPGNHYIKIGINWVLGILSDIIRFGVAAELKTHKPLNQPKTMKKRKSLEPVVVSDNESTTSDNEPPVKKNRRRGPNKKCTHVEKLINDAKSTAFDDVSSALFTQKEMSELLHLPLPPIEDDALLVAEDLGFSWIDEEVSLLSHSVDI